MIIFNFIIIFAIAYVLFFHYEWLAYLEQLQFKGREQDPSDAYILGCKISGIFLFLFGILMLIYNLG